MIAVAHSILNRRDDPWNVFPNNLSNVITELQSPGSPHGQYRGYREDGVIVPRYMRAMNHYSSNIVFPWHIENSTIELNAMMRSLRESVKAYYGIIADNTNDATVFWQSTTGPNWPHNFKRSTSNIPSYWVHSFWIHSGPCNSCNVPFKNP